MSIWAKRFGTMLLTGLFLAGCSSTIPDLIKRVPKDNIQVDEVQQKPDEYLDSLVRWGGTILQVENLAEKTHIEVLGRKLSSNGKPDSTSRSQGRFKIALQGFKEPEEFPKDRLITVYGKLTEVIEGQVGTYNYRYPIVEPKAFYLWSKERNYRHHDYYDPFYYPWHPYWYRYPYPYYW
ncbi:MAG: Slp family lipoprotein [Gammaproteobacteria bacterium]|nr:Slp family lipoprotein [Gammaproteobacteria bacterium]